MKESGGSTEGVAHRQMAQNIFAEVTLAEAFLGSKTIKPAATAPSTW